MDEGERNRRETARVLSRVFERERVHDASQLFEGHDPLAELAKLIGSASEAGYGPLGGGESHHAQNGYRHPMQAVMKYRPRPEDAFFPEDHMFYTEMDYFESDDD